MDDDDAVAELPLAQLRVCGILHRGPRPMSALSRDLGVSLSAMTQIADRLERANLVKRVAEDNDRRVRCLRLTPRGESIMRRREDVRTGRITAALARLPAKKRKEVLAALRNAAGRLPGRQGTETALHSWQRRSYENDCWRPRGVGGRGLRPDLFGFRFAADPSSNFRTAKVVTRRLAFDHQRHRHAGAGAVVDVGAQVTGRIDSFGTVPDAKDPTKRMTVDFGSMVHKGDVLA